jgi:O-antigen/teichoic acid export membrane protein
MRIDYFMLTGNVSNYELGLFTASSRLSEAWYFLPTSLAASVLPKLILFKEDNYEKYYKYLQDLASILTFVAIFIALLSTLFSFELVDIIYSKQYAGSANYFVIQIWSGIFVSMGISRASWLLIGNLQKFSMIYLAISMGIKLTLNLFFIPTFGVMGAILTTLFTQFSVAILLPLLFKSTRMTVLIGIRSLMPFYWIRAFRNLRSLF